MGGMRANRRMRQKAYKNEYRYEQYDSIRAYRFRIYPNDRCRSEIDMQLSLSKNFYNKLLEKSKDTYGKDRSFRPKRSAFNTIKKKITARFQ